MPDLVNLGAPCIVVEDQAAHTDLFRQFAGEFGVPESFFGFIRSGKVAEIIVPALIEKRRIAAIISNGRNDYEGPVGVLSFFYGLRRSGFSGVLVLNSCLDFAGLQDVLSELRVEVAAKEDPSQVFQILHNSGVIPIASFA